MDLEPMKKIPHNFSELLEGELSADEIMPCASPLGYPAKKMSLREGTMRKAWS